MFSKSILPIFAALLFSNNIHAAIITEANVASDFSNDLNNTTQLNTFGIGNTSVFGTIGENGDNRDLFTFEIATGTTLESLVIYYETDKHNAFTSFALYRGDYATFDTVEFINLNEFNSGIDLLQFDSAPGLQPAGFYTMHIIETNNEFAHFQIDTKVISAIPIPAAIWLFASGLIGLVGVARSKK